METHFTRRIFPRLTAPLLSTISAACRPFMSTHIHSALNSAKRAIVDASLPSTVPIFASPATEKRTETTSITTPKTAAIVLIADELLSGKVRDENGFFLARFLFKQGIDLKHMVVIPDSIEEIARHVTDLSSKYDYVFTSGGIGPTHDDVTYDAIAHAFNRPLVLDEAVRAGMYKHMRRTPTESDMRMATFPHPCRKLESEDLWVPIVVVENVYILPGIPYLFRRMIESNAHHFVGRPKTLLNVYTKTDEGVLAPVLSQAQSSNPGIAIGSYPQTVPGAPHHVKVTIEGRDPEVVSQIANEVKEKVNGSFNLDDIIPPQAKL
eukprot:TRINITY_DN3762_c0_g1_i1.p1 TRINITY_DN3762_c0_g1~~TRINITY_DN3762_c0_g1_i1.p1  ORF type:complete len:322 (-),score=63.90 TRINITY_DN3762_c0_g1_i1:93-1058(-)